MEIVYVAGFAAWLLVAWKWGKWKNIKQYLSTIYFLIMGDLLYSFLNGMHLLWKYESPAFNIKHSIIELVLMFLVYPCVVVLFLSHYPSRWIKQLLYNSLFIFIFWSNELIVYMLGIFSYHRGWNIWWSLLVDALIFPLLRLNQQKPVIAYILFLAIHSIFFFSFGNLEFLP